MERQAPVEECRRAVRSRFWLSPDTRIAVGIERFDYTKGIVDRMRAVDVLLESHPEWRGKLVFIQAAAPTRSKLTAYSGLQAAADEEAEAINARWGNDSYKPVVALRSPMHEPAEQCSHKAVFRAADLCIVSSLHDGMNLVAKGVRRCPAHGEQWVLVLVELRRRFALTTGSADQSIPTTPTEWRKRSIHKRCGWTQASSARLDAGDARDPVLQAQRLPLGRADAPRRGAPEAAREHRARGGGLSSVVDEGVLVF